jgi:hypothetical protein
MYSTERRWYSIKRPMRLRVVLESYKIISMAVYFNNSGLKLETGRMVFEWEPLYLC